MTDRSAFAAAVAEPDQRPLRVRLAGREWNLPAVMPALVPLRLAALDGPWPDADDDAALEVGRSLTPHVDEWLDAGVPPSRVRRVVSWAIVALQAVDRPGPLAGGRGVPVSECLDRWQLLEADFLREYGLDLPVEVRRMSWRRFSALLGGLSPRSTWALSLWGPNARRSITDTAAAERYFASIN